MATNSTEKSKEGDLVKWLINNQFCVAVRPLKAATVQSVEIGSPLEYSVNGDIIVVSGNEANILCLSLENIEATGGENIKTLLRGPAIIDSDHLHLEASVTAATCKAVLLALDIIYYENVATWITQTT